MNNLLTKIFGTKHERDAKRLRPAVEEINRYREELKNLSGEELTGKTAEFRKRL